MVAVGQRDSHAWEVRLPVKEPRHDPRYEVASRLSRCILPLLGQESNHAPLSPWSADHVHQFEMRNHLVTNLRGRQALHWLSRDETLAKY